MDYETEVGSGTASSSYHDHADHFDLGGAPRPSGGEGTDLDTHLAELNDLRVHLAEITRHLEGIEPEPVVGVLHPETGPVDPLDQLQVAVVIGELRRRLAGVRVLACSATADGTTLFDGEPVYPLVAAAGNEPITLDCLVAPGPDHDSAVELSGRLGLPVHYVGAGWAGGSHDVLALLDRMLDVEFIAQRGHYLRILGTVPRAARFVLSSFDVENSSSTGVAGIARATDLEAVVLADQLAPTDLVGIVGAADLVVTDRLAVAALSNGLLQPVLLVAKDDRNLKWAQDAGIMGGMPSDLVALAGEVFAEEALPSREQLVRSADLSLDALAGSILTSLGGPVARTVGARLTDLVARVQILESVNEGLRRTMVRDRKTLYDRIAAIDSASVAAALVPASHSRPQMHPRTAAEAEIHIAQLKDELGRIYSTRLFRYSKPVRSLYGRVRSLVQ